MLLFCAILTDNENKRKFISYHFSTFLISLSLVLRPLFKLIYSSLPDKMARQSHVDQAGNHHGDAEHPSGGQEQEGEEVAHYL